MKMNSYQIMIKRHLFRKMFWSSLSCHVVVTESLAFVILLILSCTIRHGRVRACHELFGVYKRHMVTTFSRCWVSYGALSE